MLEIFCNHSLIVNSTELGEDPGTTEDSPIEIEDHGTSADNP